ncbi:SLATT domain-containing protein, partial [Streptomyces synnematoformans]|uniref:SLATT domain-containing protein n=1 Tax=Streptomyces synnematoformans TaxID=415721 RepID=UPI0031CEE908
MNHSEETRTTGPVTGVDRAGANGGPDGPGERPGDLLARPFPLGDWGDPAKRLDELYLWAEEGALRTARSYLAARRTKRRAARTL